MKVTRTSAFTGETITMDLPVTEKQMDEYRNGCDAIQSVFPNLTPGQREFIMTGTTTTEWQCAFGEE